MASMDIFIGVQEQNHLSVCMHANLDFVKSFMKDYMSGLAGEKAYILRHTMYRDNDDCEIMYSNSDDSMVVVKIVVDEHGDAKKVFDYEKDILPHLYSPTGPLPHELS